MQSEDSIFNLQGNRLRGRVLVYDGEAVAERDGVRVTNGRGFASVLADLDGTPAPG